MLRAPLWSSQDTACFRSGFPGQPGGLQAWTHWITKACTLGLQSITSGVPWGKSPTALRYLRNQRVLVQVKELTLRKQRYHTVITTDISCFSEWSFSLHEFIHGDAIYQSFTIQLTKQYQVPIICQVLCHILGSSHLEELANSGPCLISLCISNLAHGAWREGAQQTSASGVITEVLLEMGVRPQQASPSKSREVNTPNAHTLITAHESIYHAGQGSQT